MLTLEGNTLKKKTILLLITLLFLFSLNTIASANIADQGLIDSAADNNTNAVRLYLDNGANVNCSLPLRANRVYGNPVYWLEGKPYHDVFHTPLFYAIYKMNTDMIQLLLSRGAYIQDQDMFVAIEGWDDDRVLSNLQILIENGGNVNAKHNRDTFQDYSRPYGLGLLTYSIERKASLPLLKLLIAYGADVNQIDSFGNTPLITICKYTYCTNMTEIALELIQDGADPNVKNKEGKTALDYAIQNKHDAVIRALLPITS